MTSSISRTEKRSRGRPKTNPTSIHLTLPPPDLDALDAYAGSADAPLTRPQAIRAILADWLKGHGFLKRAGDHPKPAGPATDAIDLMEGHIAKDRAKRKR